MKKNTKIKPFKLGLNIWFSELINMLVFFALAFIVILISVNILAIDLLSIMGSYVKIFIIALGYIGIAMGAYNSYKSYSEYKTFIPKSAKYYCSLLQLILFCLIGYVFYTFSVDVILFIGMYLTIFVAFAFNTLLIDLNNKKYPKEKNNKKGIKKVEHKETENNINSRMIDIDLLK